MSETTTDIIGGAADVAPDSTTIIGDATGAIDPKVGAEGVAPVEAGKEPVAGESKAQTAEAVPEKYAEFKMPEGVEFDKDMQERAEPLFKELKLSQEQAQKTAEFLAKERAASLKSNADQYLAYVQGLADASKADKEIGGEKLAESASHANQFIQKFGRGEKGAEVFKVLEETGMGNHPAIISLLAKAHKAMAEDSPSSGAPSSTGDKIPLASLLFNQVGTIR